MTPIEMPTSLIGKRYLLQTPLGQGGMGIVYRALDRLTGQAVAVKSVLIPTEHLIFMSRTDNVNLNLALAQEFRLLASLRHPNIISVLDYGFDADHQPYFVMELLEKAETIAEAALKQSTEFKITLLIQTLQALAYLHRRGILHRDLKPGNVLYVGGQVKVLDFGLSIMRENAPEVGGLTQGTLAYMAPESLSGGQVSEATDLYAMGMIGYELLVGQHPFKIESVTTLITDILYTAPNLDAAHLTPPLKSVLGRLLTKDPTHRYQDASEVIEALAQTVGLALVDETNAMRESFLQSARLVGRDAELAQLTGILGQATAGKGSVWLIGGESGVGKSRLLTELRTLALVQGALALSGQAVNEGGSTFQVWEPLLRTLSLTSNLSLEEASVLKALIGNIDTLLGQPIPDAPELTPQATRERLFGVIVAVLARQPQPVLAILEDLQWASEESLALLNRLALLTQNRPLLIVGSYRDDERPNLPGTIPTAQVIKLNRLGAAGIRELSELMLGKAGRQTQVITLLQRETEGNVFFLVEVVRALAEEAGQLQNIGTATLPLHIMAGGVQRIVQRRLSHVSETDLPLLQAAAVSGRQVDLKVMQALSPQTNLDTWLNDCASAAVLEVQEGRWLFSHDKLREGVLAALSGTMRKEWHRRLGEAMETLYADMPQQAAAMAYHFSQAEVWDKASLYFIRAGDAAAQLNAEAEARTYYARALEANAKLPDNLDTKRQRAETLIKQVRVSYASDDTGRSLERMVEAESLVKILPGADGQPGSDRLLMARIHYWLGRIYYVRNQFPEAFGYYQQVMRVAQEYGNEELMIIPAATFGRIFAMQGYHNRALTFLNQALGPLYRLGNWFEWIWTQGFLGLATAGAGDAIQGEIEIQRALDLSIQQDNVPGMALSWSAMWWVYYFQDDAPKMLHASTNSVDAATRSGTNLYAYLGATYKAYAYARFGQHDAALEALALAKQVAREMGGQLVVAELVLALEAEVHYRAGRFDEAISKAQESAARAKISGNKGSEALAYRVWAWTLAALHPPQYAEAETKMQLSCQIFLETGSMPDTARSELALGWLYRDQGKLEQATPYLERAEERFKAFQGIGRTEPRKPGA